MVIEEQRLIKKKKRIEALYSIWLLLTNVNIDTTHQVLDLSV